MLKNEAFAGERPSENEALKKDQTIFQRKYKISFCIVGRLSGLS